QVEIGEGTEPAPGVQRRHTITIFVIRRSGHDGRTLDGKHEAPMRRNDESWRCNRIILSLSRAEAKADLCEPAGDRRSATQRLVEENIRRQPRKPVYSGHADDRRGRKRALCRKTLCRGRLLCVADLQLEQPRLLLPRSLVRSAEEAVPDEKFQVVIGSGAAVKSCCPERRSQPALEQTRRPWFALLSGSPDDPERRDREHADLSLRLLVEIFQSVRAIVFHVRTLVGSRPRDSIVLVDGAHGGVLALLIAPIPEPIAAAHLTVIGDSAGIARFGLNVAKIV